APIRAGSWPVAGQKLHRAAWRRGRDELASRLRHHRHLLAARTGRDAGAAFGGGLRLERRLPGRRGGSLSPSMWTAGVTTRAPEVAAVRDVRRAPGASDAAPPVPQWLPGHS